MKNKLITLFVLMIFISTAAWSQVSFSLRAGINFQNLNGKDGDGDKLENDLTTGFHAGFDVGIPVAPDFYFQPGLLFTTKGANNFFELDDLKISTSYLELPLHFAYKPQLGSGRLIVGLGPYLAYGVGGKAKYDGEKEDIKFKNDVSEEDVDILYFRPLDAGADIFFGYEFSFGLFAQLNAQLGLLNIVPKFEGEDPDDTIKNTGFGISLGYRF